MLNVTHIIEQRDRREADAPAVEKARWFLDQIAQDPKEIQRIANFFLDQLERFHEAPTASAERFYPPPAAGTAIVIDYSQFPSWPA